ncbi:MULTISPECIES: hypothetical protein [unclassified Bradyrhizobium]|nr:MULTISPECIES: hypothetical protein [unclassified Bradyrhizobium]
MTAGGDGWIKSRRRHPAAELLAEVERTTEPVSAGLWLRPR